MGRIARTAADGVGATEWLEMGGEKNKMQPTNPNAHTYVTGNRQCVPTVLQNARISCGEVNVRSLRTSGVFGKFCAEVLLCGYQRGESVESLEPLGTAA